MNLLAVCFSFIYPCIFVIFTSTRAARTVWWISIRNTITPPLYLYFSIPRPWRIYTHTHYTYTHTHTDILKIVVFDGKIARLLPPLPLGRWRLHWRVRVLAALTIMDYFTILLTSKGHAVASGCPESKIGLVEVGVTVYPQMWGLNRGRVLVVGRAVFGE